jgi:transcriptional regulator with XRE-family HTH domain/Zn-dependent peptidase ImmA (M78 family)
MDFADSWTEIGARVREARIALGLTQAQLAGQLTMDRTALAKAEAGDRRLDALELFHLSDALDVSIDHFVVRPPTAIVSRRAALTESLDADAARAEYRTQARLQSWYRDVRQLVDLGTLQPSQPFRCSSKVSDRAAARVAAAEVRQELGLGQRPVGRLADAASALGLLVLCTDLPADGASLTEPQVGVAVVSTHADPGRRRATAAHELGHHVLGDEYSADVGISASRSERERIVDTFAAEFLLPEPALTARWPRGSDEAVCRSEVIQLAADFRVSWSLLLRQAQHARLLGRSLAQRWSAQAPTRAEFLAVLGGLPQPDLEPGETPASYARAVLDAYRDWQISSARAVEMLRGRVSEDDLPVIDEPDPGP